MLPDESVSLRAYRSSVADVVPLDRETERRARRTAGATGDKAAGAKLVTACLPFVMSIALEYRRWGIPLEDIVQQGNLGLLAGRVEVRPRPRVPPRDLRRVLDPRRDSRLRRARVPGRPTGHDEGRAAGAARVPADARVGPGGAGRRQRDDAGEGGDALAAAREPRDEPRRADRRLRRDGRSARRGVAVARGRREQPRAPRPRARRGRRGAARPHASASSSSCASG